MGYLAYQTIDSILESGASTSAKLLAVALFSHMNRKTGKCNPSVRYLAECISSSPTTVQRALKELQTLGMISWETTRQKFDKFNSNNYKLLFTVSDTGTSTGTPCGTRSGTSTGTVPVVDTLVDTPVDTVKSGTESREPGEPRNKENTGRFSPPDISDVRAYCAERNRGVDPDKWFDFYVSKGWMIGKNKMKDWKAAVRTWEKKAEPAQEKVFGADWL